MPSQTDLSNMGDGAASAASTTAPELPTVTIATKPPAFPAVTMATKPPAFPTAPIATSPPSVAMTTMSPTGGVRTLRTEAILRGYGAQGVQWWGEVQTRYGEIPRRYHTLTHIEHMLELAEIHRDNLKDYEAVVLATIFHDIIYDPWAKDNEESSAASFQTFSADLNMDPALTKKVTDLIIATKNHVTDGHKAGCSGSDDIHYFIDMDMQVLGWPEEEYAVYAKQIREEYKHMPDEEYRKGRIEVLKKLFQSPHIYATKVFREQFEAQSRSNMVAEIKRLERQ